MPQLPLIQAVSAGHYWPNEEQEPGAGEITGGASAFDGWQMRSDQAACLPAGFRVRFRLPGVRQLFFEGYAVFIQLDVATCFEVFHDPADHFT